MRKCDYNKSIFSADVPLRHGQHHRSLRPHSRKVHTVIVGKPLKLPTSTRSTLLFSSVTGASGSFDNMIYILRKRTTK